MWSSYQRKKTLNIKCLTDKLSNWKHFKGDTASQFTIKYRACERSLSTVVLALPAPDKAALPPFMSLQAHTLRVKSQEPVDMEVPSGEVLRQETLFSWP